MSDPLQALLAKAFRTAPAAQANQVISEVRVQEASAFAEALNYEIVLPAQGALEHLTTRALPKLVYYLECRGVRIPRCPHVFISLFMGETLHFIRCEDFLEQLVALTGLSPAEMVKRYGG